MRRLAAVAGLLLAVLACTLPPYNEDLSLAQMSAADMDPVAAVGPFRFWPGELEDKDVYFYPSKDSLNERLYGVPANPDFPLRGFVLTMGEYYGRLVFIDHNGLDYYTTGDRGIDVGNSDPDRFSFAGQTVKDGAPGLPEHVGGAVFRPDGGRWYADFDEFFTESPTDLNGSGPALGASFFPAGGNFDYLHVLYRIGPEDYGEEAWRAGAGGLAFDSTIRSLWLPGLPAEMESAFYFHNRADPSRSSYLSWYDPERRGYRNFRWNDSLQLHVMTNLQRRIDLVLSNGWLYSRGENLGYLYDAEGRFLNQFALGGLDLVYEIFLGPAPGTPHVVFTMEAWAPGGGKEDPKLYFLVYVLPTSKLADL